MLKVTVIKSKTKCASCADTEKICKEIAANYPDDVEIKILIDGEPETADFGLYSTPVVALGYKIYSMGKPVIKEKVETWIRKELALLKNA